MKLCCGGQLHCWVFWIFFHVPWHWGFPTACQRSRASLQHNPRCFDLRFHLHIYNKSMNRKVSSVILVWFLAISLAAATIVSHGRRSTYHTHFKAFCYVAHPVGVWPVFQRTVGRPGLQCELHAEPEGFRVMSLSLVGHYEWRVKCKGRKSTCARRMFTTATLVILWASHRISPKLLCVCFWCDRSY